MNNDISMMGLEEIARYIKDNDPVSDDDALIIKDQLSELASKIGALWDCAEGTNPNTHTQWEGLYLGTPNHDSMEYKMRKLVGYSYP